jgi:hypothetical protein
VPRYFFDLYNDMVVQDDEGVELTDLEAAKKHAQGKIDLRHYVKIRDGLGDEVHCIDFEDAVSVERGGEPV